MKFLKKYLLDILVVIAFAIISFVYFMPADMDGRILFQHDAAAGKGLGHEKELFQGCANPEIMDVSKVVSFYAIYQMLVALDEQTAHDVLDAGTYITRYADNAKSSTRCILRRNIYRHQTTEEEIKKQLEEMQERIEQLAFVLEPLSTEQDTESYNKAQSAVLKNPLIWILALSSAFMYIIRTGI